MLYIIIFVFLIKLKFFFALNTNTMFALVSLNKAKFFVWLPYLNFCKINLSSSEPLNKHLLIIVEETNIGEWLPMNQIDVFYNHVQSVP